MGKDTTIGHWEIAGVVSPKPLPTFPDGFPDSLIHEFEEKTGAKVEQGQTLAVLHTNRPETIADAERVFLEAIRWGTDAPEAQPLIYGIVK